jgi:hypothetical protein
MQNATFAHLHGNFKVLCIMHENTSRSHGTKLQHPPFQNQYALGDLAHRMAYSVPMNVLGTQPCFFHCFQKSLECKAPLFSQAAKTVVQPLFVVSLKLLRLSERRSRFCSRTDPSFATRVCSVYIWREPLGVTENAFNHIISPFVHLHLHKSSYSLKDIKDSAPALFNRQISLVFGTSSLDSLASNNPQTNLSFYELPSCSIPFSLRGGV